MRYWSNLPHETVEDTRPTFEKLSAPGPRRYFVFDFEGALVGMGGIHTGTEIGFLMHPDYWGQGFASEAVRGVVDHVWATTDWPAITADADPRNLRSVRLLTHLGFQVSGFARNTFCVGGEWSDSVYFALPRPESG